MEWERLTLRNARRFGVADAPDYCVFIPKAQWLRARRSARPQQRVDAEIGFRQGASPCEVLDLEVGQELALRPGGHMGVIETLELSFSGRRARATLLVVVEECDGAPRRI